MDIEQVQVLNEVLADENIEEFSMDGDYGFDRDCVELVTPGTDVISDIEIDNVSDEQEEENVNLGLERVSSKLA
jgi:hypothetical protein